LLPLCGAGAAAAPTPGGACSATQMNLFRRLLELEENADQLLGFGPNTYSLNDNAHALGLALRWTADEEFSAQSSLTSRFANNQLSAVTNRLIALRFMQIVHLAREDAAAADGLLAGLEPEDYAGGGASADPGSTQFGPWSVFANGAYGAGTKQPTTYDDAFAFGGTQFSVGADRRLSPHMVAGFLLSTLHQDLDFDSSESTASGGVHGVGYGITGYFQLEGDAAYLNISLGAQRMTLDTTRVVAYPSNNSLVPSVNTTFTSSTVANSWLMTFGSGYNFHTHGFAAEPYLNAQYLHTHIDGFSESSSGPDLGFATSVAGQNVSSLVSVAGLKFSYAILPPFGVILPYAYGEYRHEFKDPSQNVGSQFAMTAPGDDYFEIPTDSINPNYYEVGGGVSSVLPHGAQLYAQYMKVLKLEYYTDYVVSAGFRFEF
jgi:outer membrane autotransporter protein